VSNVSALEPVLLAYLCTRAIKVRNGKLHTGLQECRYVSI